MQAYENTHTKDYVTEKVYDALAAGCVPIYWGAPNFEQYLPQPNAVINATKFSNLSQLIVELERLASNETAYSQHLEWKTQPMHQLSAGAVL
jgi:alpha-1,4-fucosyltransferase